MSPDTFGEAAAAMVAAGILPGLTGAAVQMEKTLHLLKTTDLSVCMQTYKVLLHYEATPVNAKYLQS